MLFLKQHIKYGYFIHKGFEEIHIKYRFSYHNNVNE